MYSNYIHAYFLTHRHINTLLDICAFTSVQLTFNLFFSFSHSLTVLFHFPFLSLVTHFYLSYYFYIFSYQPDADSVDTSNSTLGIALLFIPVPSFPLARGLMYFSLARVIEEVQDTISYKPLSDPFDYISKYLLALFGHMCLYLFVLVIILLVQAHSDL